MPIAAPEVVSVRYRILLTEIQIKKLRRTWPNGDAFFPYEKMERLLAPLKVEDLNWHHPLGPHLYFTVYGDDLEGTLADALKVFEGVLGNLEHGGPEERKGRVR